MAKTCYMCDKNSTSVEHVPPKCLFPEQKDLPENVDLRRQLITVPACDEHNSRKSKDDEYLLYTLVMSVPSNEVAKNHFLTKIVRGIEKNPGVLDQFLQEQKAVLIEDSDTSEKTSSVAFKVNEQRINEELEHLVRALYFHHFNSKWLGKVNAYPNFLLCLELETAREINAPIECMDNLSNQLFESVPFYGENPEVFKYQVLDGLDVCHKFFRLHFYNGNRVTVMVGKNG